MLFCNDPQYAKYLIIKYDVLTNEINYKKASYAQTRKEIIKVLIRYGEWLKENTLDYLSLIFSIYDSESDMLPQHFILTDDEIGYIFINDEEYFKYVKTKKLQNILGL